MKQVLYTKETKDVQNTKVVSIGICVADNESDYLENDDIFKYFSLVFDKDDTEEYMQEKIEKTIQENFDYKIDKFVCVKEG